MFTAARRESGRLLENSDHHGLEKGAASSRAQSAAKNQLRF
jgi:hypothetical protein